MVLFWFPYPSLNSSNKVTTGSANGSIGSHGCGLEMQSVFICSLSPLAKWYLKRWWGRKPNRQNNFGSDCRDRCHSHPAPTTVLIAVFIHRALPLLHVIPQRHALIWTVKKQVHKTCNNAERKGKVEKVIQLTSEQCGGWGANQPPRSQKHPSNF